MAFWGLFAFMERLNLWAENGHGTVQTAGQNSSNNTLVQSSYPGCTVTVYINGTSNLASIYSDNSLTPLANPFTASNNGLAYFYAASGRYDVKFSGNGITGNFTIPDFVLGQIQSINNQTGENITLLVGNSGNNFNIASSNNNITFNLPQANANNSGFLAAADWAQFNNATHYTFSAPLVNTNGTVSLTTPLTVAQGGTNATNTTAAFDNLSPTTTKGDLIVANNTAIAVRLPVGANDLVLTADGANVTGLKWAAANLNSANGVLPIASGGTNGTTATQAFDNLSPITTKGDIIVGNNTAIAVRLGIGSDGAPLQANSANTSGMIWGPLVLTNANAVSGILPIANGGTSGNNATQAFGALSPVTTKGDLIVGNNSNINVRLPAGNNNQVLASNSANSLGLIWANAAPTDPLFSQTASVTVANNNTELTLISTGTGNTTIPANYFSVGKVLKIQAWGYHSATANPTLQYRIKFGNTTVLDTGAVVTSNSTNQVWKIEGIVTCRTTGNTGTVFAQGALSEFGQNQFPMLNTLATTIDTTATQVLNITAQWGTAAAADTTTVTNVVMEDVL